MNKPDVQINIKELYSVNLNGEPLSQGTLELIAEYVYACKSAEYAMREFGVKDTATAIRIGYTQNTLVEEEVRNTEISEDMWEHAFSTHGESLISE